MSQQISFKSLSSANLYLGGHLSEGRNLLQNGDMFIDQMNEGASVSLVSGTGAYIVDGWGVKMVQSSATVSAQQTADAPAGFIDSLKVTVTTGHAVAATDYLTIKHPVEGRKCRYLGNGTANAGYVSLQFWAKSSLAGEVFSFALQNSAGDRVYIGTFTIANANLWTQILVPNIPCDLTGTWLNTNGIGMMLYITLASGATQESSTLNAWQGTATVFAGNTQTNLTLTTNGATFQITGAQLEPGTVNTPFALLSDSDAILQAMRYLRKSFPAGTAPAQSAGIAGCVTVKNPIALGDPAEWIPFDPPMRASPTIVTYNPSAANANWRDITASSDATVSVDSPATKSTTGVIFATSGTVATLGDYLGIHYTADARLAI